MPTKFKPFLVLVAYLIWGILPLLIAQISTVSVIEIISHRILWIFIFMFAWLFMNGKHQELKAIWYRRRERKWILLCAIALGLNWLIFILSVALGRIAETSAGYYMSPIITAFFGMIFLKERFNLTKALAFAIICFAVIFYLVTFHAVPYMAIALAVTFSIYSLLRKLIVIRHDVMMTLEAGIMLPLALGGIAYLQVDGKAVFINEPIHAFYMVLLAGLTCIALFSYNIGLKHTSLANVGITFYISPTLQLLTGITFLGKTLNHDELIFFGTIWLGVAIYIANLAQGAFQQNRRKKLA